MVSCVTTVLPSPLLPIPTVTLWYAVPAVLPWMGSPLPRFPRGYRDIPAVPITVQTFKLIRGAPIIGRYRPIIFMITYL